MKRYVLVFTIICCFFCSLAYAATNMKFSGTLEAELRYTPENNWEGWDQLWLKSSIESGKAAKGVIIFGENNARRGVPTYWWDPEGRRFGLYVDKAYLTYTGPFYTGAPSSIITLGDLSFAYHPHFLKLDYWDEGGYLEKEYDQSKRGIMVEDFRLADLNVNSYYLWDGTGDLNRYSYGYSLEKQLGNKTIKFYGVDFFHDPMSQKIKALQLEYQGKNNLALNGMVANLQEKDLVEVNGQMRKSTALLWDLKGAFKVDQNQTFALRYIDFPLSFNPIYRDRTPRYDPHTNERLKWNELDYYRDQRGCIWNYEFENQTTAVTIDLANFVDHNVEYPKKTSEAVFGGEFSIFDNLTVGFWERFIDIKYSRVDELTNSQIYRSSRYYVERPFFGGNYSGRYAIASRKSDIDELCHELSIGQEVKQGLFSGINYRLGVKYRKPEPQKVFSFFDISGELPLGINIKMRYATFNRHSLGEYEYDEDDQLLLRDNILSIQAKVSF